MPGLPVPILEWLEQGAQALMGFAERIIASGPFKHTWEQRVRVQLYRERELEIRQRGRYLVHVPHPFQVSFSGSLALSREFETRIAGVDAARRKFDRISREDMEILLAL